MTIISWTNALLIAALASSAGAQIYPTKTVRVVVPFPPGGGTDILGHAIVPKLMQAWNQPVLLLNRPGSSGLGAGEIIAKATPDGYTLLLGTVGGMSIIPATGRKLSYDPLRDFAPISMLTLITPVLVAHPSVKVNSVQELIALAKGKPGQLSYGSTGHGSGGHLAMEWLKATTGIGMQHFPYDGAAATIAEVFAGKISLAFLSMPSSLSYVKSGKLKGIAVGGPRRSPVLPEVPTVAESGVPGFEYMIWYALYAPAKTPTDILDKVNAEIGKILKDPGTVRSLTAQGYEPSPGTPAALAKQMRDDQERWKNVIKSAGIKLE